MNGWILGYLIGGVVVIVVVAVLLLMIAGARRVAGKVDAILAGLHDARDGTAALWKVRDTASTAQRIVVAAVDARTALSGGGRP